MITDCMCLAPVFPPHPACAPCSLLLLLYFSVVFVSCFARLFLLLFSFCFASLHFLLNHPLHYVLFALKQYAYAHTQTHIQTYTQYMQLKQKFKQTLLAFAGGACPV